MLHKTKLLSICLCMSGLTACATDDSSTYRDYQTYTYYNSTQLYYPQGYENTNYYSDAAPTERKVVEVPETYHVGAYHSPTPHTDVDRTWVNSQNAKGYTIELSDGDKPADVAGTLQKAPKTERTAEIKYQQGGKTYYKGLYGTYPSYEDAQKAMSALPEDVKQKAGIKSWGTVQSGVGE